MKKINILGTAYTFETHKISEDCYLKTNRLDGYCSEYSKRIVIADFDEKRYFSDDEWTTEEKNCRRKQVIRHEVIHAFLNESGLSFNSMTSPGAWAKNEEMVDWLAIQWPKITKVFEKLEAL